MSKLRPCTYDCNNLTDLSGVVCGAKYELWGTVITGADVRHIWFIFNQDLGATEIAQLEYTGFRIEQEILRLDIAVTDSHGVDVC